MMMEELEYLNLLRQLNEKIKLMMLCKENNCTLLHQYVYF
jgi:hypothetical protein